MNTISLNTRQIASALRGDVVNRDSVSAPGPGHSPRDRSLSIRLDGRAPGGFVVFSHAGDDPIVCRDYVREKLNLEPWQPGQRFIRTPWSVSVQKPDDENRWVTSGAERIWKQSVTPVGTVAEKYLRDARGLDLDEVFIGSVVRFHGSLRYDDAKLPALVCLMRDIATDEPCGIHRTFLTWDGQKVDRRMLGRAKGAAIMIDARETLTGKLTIGEGFESTLSSRMADLGPCWALGSAGAIKDFPVVDGIDELSVLEERDRTSRIAVRACLKRYSAARRIVNIVTPKVGKDFNDVWLSAIEANR